MSTDRSRPTLQFKALLTRATAGAAVAGLILAGAASPAQATSTTVGSCTDGGGISWQTKVVWGDSYLGGDGVRRTQVDYAGWTTRAGFMTTDSVVTTYNGSGTLYRRLTKTASTDYRQGTVFAARNPYNPTIGRAKITIAVGKDGDGKANCVVTHTQPAVTSPSPTPTPTVTPTPPPSSPSTKTFAIWHHRWEGPNLRSYPAGVQASTNLVILGIAQSAGNGAIEYGPANGQSVADHAADVRALEARGTRVSVGFGGAGDTTQITNDTQVANFVASITRLRSTYGISGVDVDLEPSGSAWTQAYLVKALKQLETKFGASFNIGVTVALYDPHTATWLSLARALGSTMDYMAPMLYDFPEARDAAQLKAISLSKVRTMIDGGVPVEKQLLGYMLIPKSSPGYSASTPDAIRGAYAAVRASYPKHQGLFIWEDKLLAEYGWSPVALISPVVR